MPATLGQLSSKALRLEARYLAVPIDQRDCARAAYIDALYAAADLNRMLNALRRALRPARPTSAAATTTPTKRVA